MKIKNLVLSLVVSVLSLNVGAGCGQRAIIQPGEVGKVLTSSGLEPGLRSPSSFLLSWCMIEGCEKIVRLQVAKSYTEISINTVFLPKSNVDIKNVVVGLQFRVKQNDDNKSIDQIFKEVKATQEDSSTLVIGTEELSKVYLKKSPDALVDGLKSHSVEEVLVDVAEIAKEIKILINNILKNTPIEVTEVSFPSGIGEVPDVVIKAKRNLYAIDEEKARQIKELEAQLIVEEKRQTVQRVRVANDVINARAAGVPYDVYNHLKTYERFADAAEAGVSVAVGATSIPFKSQ